MTPHVSRKTNNVVVSNGNRKILDYHEFKESGPEWLRQRPTTESSNMAAKTGSTYISGTNIDSVEIPTANLEFSTVTSSKKSSQMILMTIDNQQ